MSRYNSTTHDALHAELEKERERVRALEAVNRLQAASLTSLSDLAAKLRCQAADLHDNALSVKGLRNVTGRMNSLADTLSRAAHG
jgi:hypothetical protein